MEKAVFKMDKDKTLGPDGFYMAFFQSYWDVVEMDIMEVFEEFFLNGLMGKSMNSTFITLTSKKYHSLNTKDCGPIILVTGVYKIMTKVLASRLRPHCYPG